MQRIRRLREWVRQEQVPEVVRDRVEALCDKAPSFAVAYDHPLARRTSNLVDRLIRRLDRFLCARQHVHRSPEAATLALRSWAPLHNVHPHCPRATPRGQDWTCAAQKLNGFRYSDNWLENLRIASSMAGYRQ